MVGTLPKLLKILFISNLCIIFIERTGCSMETTRRTFLYYIYVFLILVILWSAFQLSKFYIEPEEDASGSKSECFNDTLVFILPQLPDNFNPYAAVYDLDFFITLQLYRGLTRINSALVETSDLAEYWEISPDHKTYTFYLHDSLYFHDGTPITVDDFIQSVKFFLRNYSSTYTLAYYHVIEGVEEFAKGESDSIRGIEKISDRVVKITLKRPYVPFLKLLSLPQMRILPAHLLKTNFQQMLEHPVGSGPYRFVKRTSNSILLEAYRKNHIYQPRVKYFKLTGFSNDRIKDIFDHKFDLTLIAADTFLTKPGYLKFRRSASFNMFFLGFNCEKEPTDNVWFRKALSYAYNPRQIINLIENFASPAEFVSPIFLPHKSGEKPVVNYNMKKSKDILINAGIFGKSKSDLTLAFLLDTLSYYHEFALPMKVACDTLGIDLKTIYIPGLQMDTQVQMLKSVNAFIFDWEIDLPDPEYFFALLFKSDSPMNLFSYKNPVVDSLLDLAKYEEESSKRLALYAEVEDIIFKEVPMRPVLYLLDYLTYQDYVQGAYLSRMGVSNLQLDEISVDLSLWEKHNWKK